MNKPVKTYDDLVKERHQLEVLLQAQKELVKQDFLEVKQHLQPAVKAASLVGKMFTRDQSNLLVTGGVNHAVNLLVKKLILSRSGWLTRFIVPYIIKNYSSHFIAEHKPELIKRIFSMFSRKRRNEQATAGEDEQS